MKLWQGVMVMVVVVAACGNSQPATSPDATPVDAVPTRTVSGVYKVHFVTTSGDVDMPVDLSHATVAALVPPDLTSYPGTTGADGTFTIPGVPVGSYYLQAGSHYIESSSDTIDYSFAVVGRPTATIATSPTPLTFDVTGLAPWQTTDELQMYSPGSGTAAYAMQADATAAPAAAATSLSSFAYDLSHAGFPALIDGVAGDQLTMTQLATQSTATRQYRTVAKAFAPASFTVTNGGNAHLQGAFTDVAASATLDVSWDRPAFDADLVAHSPTTNPSDWSTLAVSALPEAATRGYFSDAPDVLVFAPGYASDKTAVTETWPYGDPYPAAWTRIAWVRYFRYRFITLPGAAPVAVFQRYLVYRDASTISAQAPIVPVVGLVASPQVAGKDAYGSLSGIGTSPTISWTVPTIGTPNRYYVNIYRLSNQAGTTALARIALVETSTTQVVIPPNVLATGQTYAFEIGARVVANIDPSVTPNLDSLPDATSWVMSSPATP